MNTHSSPGTSPKELVASFWRNRALIFQLTRREVVGRYRGSIAGLTWSFLHPLLMLLVYTFVFSVVFKARWSAEVPDNQTSFALILFAGIIVHGLFAECANKAPQLILSQTSYVKKIVFPLEILPWVAIGSTLFHASASLVILIAAQAAINHTLPATVVLFPIVVLPLILMTVGVAWFLSALGVYLRDIQQVIGLVTTILLFLSPVFYPRSALPEPYRRWMALNPLTFALEAGRGALIWGQGPNLIEWVGQMALGIAIAWLGFWWFQRSRRGFADVL